LKIEITELKGIRAKLIPMVEDNLQDLYEAAKHPDIWTYLPQKINSIEDTAALIQKALLQKETGIEFPFVVVDQNTDQIVGSTRFLNMSLPNRQLEIGWTWYNPSVWRSRMNTECKYLLLQYCFETLKMVRVQFCADSRNNRSNQAISRLGAVKEGVLRKNRILDDGYIRDTCVYSILVEEWPVIKARLEGFLGA
jgi:RimJ/RimL family protein N-acetyltransferase